MGEGKGRKKQGKKENRLHWSLMKRLFLSALRWKERKIHSPHARCDCLSTFALPVLHKGFSSSAEREWGQNKRQQQHKSLISTCLAMQTNTVAKELTETKAHSNADACVWWVLRFFVFLWNDLFVNPNQIDISVCRAVFSDGVIFILPQLLTNGGEKNVWVIISRVWSKSLRWHVSCKTLLQECDRVWRFAGGCTAGLWAKG